MFNEEIEIVNIAKKHKFAKTKITSFNKPINKKKIIVSENYKKEFFNNISHEIKTPLTIILGYAQLLKEENFSSERLYLEAVENIEHESIRLNSLINNLIEKAKQTKN